MEIAATAQPAYDTPAAAAAPAPPAARAARPVWRLGWLTPWRCRVILAVVLAYGFVSHLQYVRNDCPIDLSGDEAHYWDWSRDLDLSYYSKGPLVAYIIRASCAVFGDTMWAVRLPALILGVGTSLVTYLLTLKLFRSDRLALGAVLLNHIVPVFIAGSLLMTIDPPFFFCWALATYLAAVAIFDNRRWVWPVVGLVVGVGFLAKYAMLLWLPIVMIVLWIDPVARRQLLSPWLWAAVVVALLFTAPVIAWNAQHDWVSLFHVRKQTGTGAGAGFHPGYPLEFLGGQIAVLGPPIFVILVAGAVYTLRKYGKSAADPTTRRLSFLLWIGLPFFALTLVTSFLAKVQINWPAPAYFTLMILGAYFLSTRLADPALWRPWRSWFYPAVLFGLITMPIAHNMEIAYPAIAWVDRNIARPLGKKFNVRQIDFTAKLRGWAELGRIVSDQRKIVGGNRPDDVMVIGEDYHYTAQMGFYVDGQPKTYCAGSYFRTRAKRASQYDIWPDRSLDPDENPGLLGRDAVYVGYFRPDLWRAFESVEELPTIDIIRRGVKVRQFRVFRCYNFRGLRRPADLSELARTGKV